MTTFRNCFRKQRGTFNLFRLFRALSEFRGSRLSQDLKAIHETHEITGRDLDLAHASESWENIPMRWANLRNNRINRNEPRPLIGGKLPITPFGTPIAIPFNQIEGNKEPCSADERRTRQVDEWRFGVKI